MVGVACYPTVFLAFIGIAGLTTVLASVFYGGQARPYTTFLVVGDWGRLGEFNQSLVAEAMASRADKLHPDFVLGVGDNFYPNGLASTQDPAFGQSFSDPYSAPSLQVPWYNVLGNHDYGDGAPPGDALPSDCAPTDQGCYFSPVHQLSWELGARDKRWFCQRAFQKSFANGRVDMFFYDTVPFVQRYYQTKWAASTGGVLEQSWQGNLLELESSLAQSKAQWKIVIGHHPVYSNGHHNSTAELIQHVQPLLQKYGVQVYFSGHDHNLEYIKLPDQGTHYIISGAGSKCDRPFSGQTNALFQWQSSGFVTASVEEDNMECQFYSIEDNAATPLYTLTVPRVP